VSDHPTNEQLSAFIDGELSLASREAVIAHIRGCPSCAARQDALIEVAAALRTQPPISWTGAETKSLLATIAAGRPRLAPPRVRRDWTLPIAAVPALIAVAALLLVAPSLLAAGLSGSGFAALAAMGPSGGLLPAGHFLLALAALAALGAAALPLVRAR
jgi:anti-sigma factor RsiW